MCAETMKKRQNPTAMSFICTSVISGLMSVANIPIPRSAKALLKLRENQLAKPPIVPAGAPMLLSMKKYTPPALGMAVASSALARTAGRTRIPAKMYAKTTLGPVFAYAMAGKIKSPELIIAPDAMQKISKRPRSFFNLCGMV